MNTYILVGEVAVNHFENEDWEKLEELILEMKGGDIVAWDNATDRVSTLLDMLNGWNNFIDLKKEDLNGLTYDDVVNKIKKEANLRLENSISLDGLDLEILEDEENDDY